MKKRLSHKIILAVLITTAAVTARAAEEQKLIAVLQSEATIPEKCAACQALKIHGTVRAIPYLAALLAEERVGHVARYALEAMPYPEAGDALRDALAKTSGHAKAGVVDSLGWRRDKASVPLLALLLSDANETIAASAASALGRIDGDEAKVALTAACNIQNDEVRPAVQKALLNCAENRLSAGDNSAAAAIYRDLFQPQVSDEIRAAAWRGWMLSDSKQRREQVVKVLGGSDEKLRLIAIKLMREIKDHQLVKHCFQQWDSLPSSGQLATLEAHLQFGADALPTIRIASQSPHLSIRTAAWQGAGALGDESLIPALARAAAQGEPAEKMAARDALARLDGIGVEHFLFTEITRAAPADKAELLRALGQRGNAAAAPVLLHAASAPEAPVRLVAFKALRRLAVPDTLQPLLKLTADSKSTSERAEALKALYAIVQALADAEQTSPKVIAQMQGFSPAQRRNVLPLLARISTPEALVEVRKAARDSDAQLALESLRVLAQWPNAAPAQDLFDLASSATDPTARTLALRGGIIVSGREPDPAARLTLIRKALALAQFPEEKKMALSELSRIPQAEALDQALSYLEQPELINEAGLAAISIAEAFASEDPKLSDEAARKVLEYCKLQAVVKRAWALRAKPSSGSIIRDWLVAGPYEQAGAVGAIAQFYIAFPPEKPEETVKWYAAPVGDTINLSTFFPGRDNCAAYLKANIIAPESSDAMLLMGSDDGLKAWLNGTLVHGNNIDRGQVVDQDMAPIKIKKGANELLLKITQGGGGWSACARIVGADGLPIKGLRVKPQKDAAPPVSATAAAPAPMPAVVAKAAKLPPRDKTFRTLRLSDKFYAEGAYYGDFNRDGKQDIVAGPFWFEGPDFQKRHAYREAKVFDPKNYSDNFLTFSGDFNGDDWTDILSVPFPGSPGYWYANPAGKTGNWERYLAYSSIGDESPVWGDITGDGRPELLFTIDGFLGYAAPDLEKPDQPWKFHAISTQDKRYQKFTHGLGFGDINGDQRVDIIEAAGWWEQPANAKKDKPWTFHPVHFADAAAQILIADVDGDGLADVITAWHCHLYGMVWWKQIKDASGKIDWKQNVILSPAPDVSTTDFRVSQMHAFALADINGDGLKDILTGKRFWAHGQSGDKEPSAPAVIFWLELRRDGKGGASFVPHLIDDDSGVGTQVTATDLNGNGRPDIIVGNKKGIFVHLSN